MPLVPHRLPQSWRALLYEEKKGQVQGRVYGWKRSLGMSSVLLVLKVFFSLFPSPLGIAHVWDLAHW